MLVKSKMSEIKFEIATSNPQKLLLKGISVFFKPRQFERVENNSEWISSDLNNSKLVMKTSQNALLISFDSYRVRPLKIGFE